MVNIIEATPITMKISGGKSVSLGTADVAVIPSMLEMIEAKKMRIGAIAEAIDSEYHSIVFLCSSSLRRAMSNDSRFF